jgi:hypothetical protein
VPEVRVVLRTLLAVRRWDEAAILWWLNWRRERNRLAAECHRRCRSRRKKHKQTL